MNYKYNYLKLQKKKVKELETNLKAKYSIGLIGSEEVLNETLELRKATLKDSINYTKNYRFEYYNLLVKFIENIVIPFGKDYEGAIETLKEEIAEYIEKYPSNVLKAINIILTDLDTSDDEYPNFLTHIN